MIDYSARRAELGECSKNSSFESLRKCSSLSPSLSRRSRAPTRETKPKSIKSALALWDQVDLLDDSSGKHQRSKGSIKLKKEPHSRKMSYTPSALQVRRSSSFDDFNSSSLRSLEFFNDIDSNSVSDLDNSFEEAPWKPVDFRIRRTTSGNQLDELRERSSIRGREIARSLNKGGIVVAFPSAIASERTRERSLSPQRLARDRSTSPTTPIRRNNGSSTSLAVTPPEYWAKPEHRLSSGLVGLPTSGSCPSLSLVSCSSASTSATNPAATSKREKRRERAKPEHRLSSRLVGLPKSGSCPSLSLASCSSASTSATNPATNPAATSKREKRRERRKARSRSPAKGTWSRLSGRNLMGSDPNLSSASLSHSDSFHSTTSSFSNAADRRASNMFLTGSRIRRRHGESSENKSTRPTSQSESGQSNEKLKRAFSKPEVYALQRLLDSPAFNRNCTL